jgi:hypothetical protein
MNSIKNEHQASSIMTWTTKQHQHEEF